MQTIVMAIKNVFLGKEAKNAGWLICGKIAQMFLSLFVGVLSARYLGPDNYGLIGYGAAYVNFFMSFCTLGINSVIIKDFIDNPQEQGKTIGTTIVLRAISSLFSAVMIVSIVAVLDKGEPITIAVAALCSVALIFHVFDTVNYWFQYQYKSRITAIVTFVAYVITSAYRVILLIYKKNVMWFAFASSIDYVIVGILLLLIYKKHKGPKLTFSFSKGKKLINTSYHYILSGMMVSIYGQTDKLMLKQMIDESNVGYYTTAVNICTMWTFVLMAIIDSIYPTILRYYKQSYDEYERKNRQLYAIVFYISVTVSLIIQFAGEYVVQLLYGKEYLPAVIPLKIITWYVAFSYLGVARNAWIVCENNQKYLKYMYLGAAVINVILNLVLIPTYGTSGAATASLITQICTSIVLPFFIPAMRPNCKLIIEGIMLKKTFVKNKTLT